MSFEFGNKIFVVEADNSSNEFEFITRSGYQSQVPNTPTVLDGVRAETGNFWDSLDNSFFIYKDFREDNPLEVTITQNLVALSIGGTAPKFETGVVKVSGKSDITLSASEINKRIGNTELSISPSQNIAKDGRIVETPRAFTDHYVELNTPVSEKEIEGINLPVKPKIYSSRSEYNYFLKEYEEIIKSPSLSENILPNLYCLEFYNFQEDLTKETDAKLNISVGNSVPKRFYEVTALNPTVSGDYFAYLPTVYRDVISKEAQASLGLPTAEAVVASVEEALAPPPAVSSAIGGTPSAFESAGGLSSPPSLPPGATAATELSPSELTLKFRNLIFAHKDVETINQVQEKKELFPMFNEIKFSTEPTGLILSILEQSKTLDSLIYSYVASEQGDDILPSQPLNFSIFSKPVSTETSFSEENLVNIYDPFGNIDNDFFLFTKDNGFNFGPGDASSTIAYINIDGLSLQEKFDFQNISSLQKFKNTILNSVAKSKLKKVFKDNQRSLKDIFEGEECYSETLFYKISKYSNVIDDFGTRTRGPLIQNIFIPNSSKVDLLNYIDTQVKYNKNYAYDVSAVKVVIGNEYRYENVKTNLVNRPQGLVKDLTADYEVRQSVRMFEVPIVPNVETRVIDSPPIFPNVDIVPSLNGSQQLRLNLSNNTGEYYLKPIIIDSSDELEFNEVRRSQKIPAPEPILFKNDDLPQAFEIRRLNFAPQTYSDFANAVTNVISTTYQSPDNPENNIVTDSVSFIDVLPVNINFYYTFRMIDQHGHISNPTSVFQVRLVEDAAGFIYPEISTYEFRDLDMFNTTLPFRKYICIRPSLSQVLLNNEDEIPPDIDEFSVSAAKLGSREEGLIGKKFKLRVISKSSQRKIDFNFQFGRVNTEKQ